MNIPYLSKVVAAFLGGVVIALGGGLIYVRVSQSAHPQAVWFQKAAAVDDTPSIAAPDQTAPPADNSRQAPTTSTAKAPERAPSHSMSQRPVVKPHLTRAADTKSAPLHRVSLQKTAPKKSTIEIAQNRPTPQPMDPPAVEEKDTDASANTVPADAPADTSDANTSPEATAESQTAAPDPAPAPKRQPMTVTLAAGTGLVIRLGETLSTEHNYAGDTFRATLDAPIIRNGYIIADKGSKVLGRIAAARKPGRLDGVSELVLTLKEINTTDGQRVNVATGAWDKKGGSSAGESAAEIAGGAALGAVIGGIAGGGKGAAIGAGAGGAIGTGAALAGRAKPAVLPTETRLTFRLSAPVTITERLNF